jgi:5-methylcytosine-specific restriction protein A
MTEVAMMQVIGRAVPEWIGKHPDQAVPKKVALRIWDREKGRCHLSGRKIGAGEKWELDHVISLTRGGEHRESNLKPALVEKHREKTAAENSEDARADRIKAKHLGLWEKPKGNRRLQSAPFPKSARYQGGA